MKIFKKLTKKIVKLYEKVDMLNEEIEKQWELINFELGGQQYLKEVFPDTTKFLKVNFNKKTKTLSGIQVYYSRYSDSYIINKGEYPICNYNNIEYSSKKEFDNIFNVAKRAENELIAKCNKFSSWFEKYGAKMNEISPTYFNGENKKDRNFRLSDNKIKVGETNDFFDRWANSVVAEIYLPIEEKEFHKIMKTLPKQHIMGEDILQFNEEK